MPVILVVAVAVVCVVLIAALAVFNRVRRRRREACVFYDGPQRITYWPTLQESAKSTPLVLRLRITDDMIHITPVRTQTGSVHDWHFASASAVAIPAADDVLLTTDETTFCMHARTGNEDLMPLLRAAGVLLRAA